MFMTSFTLLLAAASLQASDQTRPAREAFTTCMRTFLNQRVEARASIEEFRTALPQQCTQQEAAYRAAIVRRETGLRATRANADQQANMEIEEMRAMYVERFQDYTTPGT